MSGATGTVDQPKADAGTLDASVSELLSLMGNGDDATQDAQVEGGWTAAIKPTRARAGVSEADYDTALRAAMPAITAARALAPLTPKTKPALDAMEDAINVAATSGGRKNFESASGALRQVLTHAAAANKAVVEEFAARHAAAVRRLGDRPARIGVLTAAPASVTTALRTATDARDAATAGSTANPPDWTTAFAQLGNLNGAIDPLDATCLTEAQAKVTNFATRYKAVNDIKAVGRGIVPKYTECLAARKRMDTLIARADGLGALEASIGAETATVALETAANPSDIAKQQTVAAASRTVSQLKDKELAKMPLLAKAELAFDLCANEVPTDQATLDQLVRVYNNSPPDKAFLKKRAEQRKVIASKVAAMPEIAGLYDKKGKFDASKWNAFIQDPDKVRDLMENVSHVQADTLGMPRIPVTKSPDPPEGRDPNGGLTFGGYDPATNSVSLNLHPDCLEPADEALTTILHEMFHAHQDIIVRRLKAGEIGPSDPDYATAMMYLVNDIPRGYLFAADVGHAAYAKQPTEIDAEDQGGAAATETLALAKKNAKKKK